MNMLRPYIGRVVGLLIAWLSAQVAIRWHITVSTEQQAQFAEAVVNIIAGFVAVYLATHKTADKWFNPGDAASSHLAASEKIESRQLKQ